MIFNIVSSIFFSCQLYYFKTAVLSKLGATPARAGDLPEHLAEEQLRPGQQRY